MYLWAQTPRREYAHTGELRTVLFSFIELMYMLFDYNIVIENKSLNQPI